ncbi:MAG: 3-oxoadipate enol-lactonase 2 [Alphaproteobacteria bacterium MarineAlpha5_Bin9]|nr:MAG: 3-oxoadipate enol-lactonase 2 [Alphaproteobacteria bacterium MarineAlpha5_Bin9]|tara:strand:- start:15199 stop:15972 length:774 start_codon:yes stop_codon:yes gene_type:complete
MKSGHDNFSTFFEINLKSNIPNIFIHGVGLDNTMWKPQKNYLESISCVYYDLLNHGKSKKGNKNLNFEDFNNQIINLTNYINVKKFNIIGFSLGALIAQHFCVNYPDKVNKLILIASVFSRNSQQKLKVKNRYKECLDGKNISDNSIKRWFNQEYLEANPSVYNYFLKILNQNNSKDFLSAYKLFVESDKYKINFSNIKIPTLIMTGKNDIGSTTEMSYKLSEKINKSTVYIVKNTKHMASYEKKDIVNDKILQFIK